MTTIVSDSFTGTGPTELSAYNGAWSQVTGSSTTINVSGNRARVGAFALTSYYTRSETPPSADYDVAGDFFISNYSLTGASQGGFLGRFSTTEKTGYLCMLRMPEKELRLYRLNNATSTLLGTVSGLTIAEGTTIGVRMRMVGSQISVFVNGSGTASIDVTDGSPVSQVGKVGAHAYRNATEDARIELDNLLAETIAGDTTAPVLTSPTGTQTGSTTASGTVTTDEGNGTLYYRATTNASESAATVKAGSSQAVSTTGSQAVSVTGLTASTSYYLHYVHEDAALNQSNVVHSTQFTTTAAVVKGARVTLYNASTPQASLSGIRALWWDATDPTGAPIYTTASATTDASGIITLNLNATTALSIGASGFMLLYKLDGTDHRDSLAFAGRVAVSDIS